MTRVQVPATWLQQGYLPAVCPRHGVHATTSTKRTWYTRIPAWVYLICLFSLLIGLIVALAVRSSVEGPLPGCARCTAAKRRYRLVTLAIWAAAPIVLTIGIAAKSGLLDFLALLAALAGLVLFLLRDNLRVSGELANDKTWVELRGVHEGLAGLIEAALRPAPPGPPPTVTAYVNHLQPGQSPSGAEVQSNTAGSTILPGA